MIKNFIFIFFPILAFSQLSEKVNILFSELNTFERVESKHISYGGFPSKSYQLFEAIDSIASTDEIVYMVENGNLSTKAYLSYLLVNRKYKRNTEIFKLFLKNNDTLNVTVGCVGHSSTLAAEFYSYFIHEKRKIEDRKELDSEILKDPKAYEFFPLEEYHSNWNYEEIINSILELNSIVLDSDLINPITISTVFVLNNYDFNNYTKVKSITTKYPTRETLATLAGFQNEKDLNIILQNKKINFLAISKFPHSSFFPYLEKSLEKEYENLDYYQAITSYCTKESLVLLDKLFEKILVENKSFALLGDELLDYLAKYIEEKNCPEHQDFLAKINDHFNSNSP
jgi:hypothetical protein